MLDAVTLQELAREYCRRMTSGNVDEILKMFTENARFEDPVGSPPLFGLDELRVHLERACAAKTVDIPGTPVAARDGRHVAIPVAAYMNYLPLGPTLTRHGYLGTPDDPYRKRIKFSLTSIIRVGPDELFEAVWIYWGKSDLSLLDPGQE
ncbi:nuclear transport factor 2 family protein [Streptomyces litchfieldiae]|uniref:Nuclear transport factor 2 family protein n=1 Tax=Streptomyces litchfieldiae TaxID=3075543 RepID=A0ABU2MQ21_9ACTN|nr:nuclear transport factor 2 family protein [Streptomyces sp. DSM 44938]MDT0343453.1 nuclear transport factor 2 family protein [Streptomyces sp. DSM 44938]